MAMAMARARQVQHRPERETARGRELAEARKEIKQLKRLVSRLQKTIQKMEDQRGIQVDLAEASPEPLAKVEATTVPVVIEQKDEDKCSNCGSTALATFTTPGGKKLVSCKNCKTRR